MRRLAKNLILATSVVSAIFIVDLSCAGAASLPYEQTCHVEKFRSLNTSDRQYLDFWSNPTSLKIIIRLKKWKNLNLLKNLNRLRRHAKLNLTLLNKIC